MIRVLSSVLVAMGLLGGVEKAAAARRKGCSRSRDAEKFCAGSEESTGVCTR